MWYENNSLGGFLGQTFLPSAQGLNQPPADNPPNFVVSRPIKNQSNLQPK